MRLLALLFSLYFLVLSCQACADEQTRPDQAKARVSAGQSRHCPEGSIGDWCSPLCQCHCCPGFALPAALPALTVAAQAATGPLLYAAAPVPGIPGRTPAPRWQPPQLT